MTKAIFALRSTPWSFVRAGRAGAQFFGYNDHFGQGYNAYLNAADTFRDLNARVWRDALPWHLIEPTTAGVYNFSPTGDAFGQDFFAFLARQIANGHDFVQYWIAQYTNAGVHPTDVNSPTWRTALANAMREVATRLMAAGQPANGLVFCLDNEPNSEFLAMAPWYQGSGNEVTYTRTCQHLRSALKALNPAIRVAHGEMVDGDHGFYNPWRAAQEADPGYFAGMDILSNHLYSNNDPVVGALAPPEVLFDRCAPYFQAQLAAAAAIGRTDITTAITECGGGPAETAPPELWYRLSRMPFVFSMLPGFEFYIHYAGRDTINDFGIMESDALTLRYPATILRDAFASLNLATARSQFADSRGSVAVKMTVPGGQRCAIWNTLGSPVVDLVVDAAGSGGTLSARTVGGTDLETRALAAGRNQITGIKAAPQAKVIWANVPIDFVGMPG